MDENERRILDRSVYIRRSGKWGSVGKLREGASHAMQRSNIAACRYGPFLFHQSKSQWITSNRVEMTVIRSSASISLMPKKCLWGFVEYSCTFYPFFRSVRQHSETVGTDGTPTPETRFTSKSRGSPSRSARHAPLRQHFPLTTQRSHACAAGRSTLTGPSSPFPPCPSSSCPPTTPSPFWPFRASTPPAAD